MGKFRSKTLKPEVVALTVAYPVDAYTTMQGSREFDFAFGWLEKISTSLRARKKERRVQQYADVLGNNALLASGKEFKLDVPRRVKNGVVSSRQRGFVAGMPGQESEFVVVLPIEQPMAQNESKLKAAKTAMIGSGIQFVRSEVVLTPDVLNNSYLSPTSLAIGQAVVGLAQVSNNSGGGQ